MNREHERAGHDLDQTKLSGIAGTGDVAIIDNDNVGTTGEEALIKGTLQFMAPEVMLDQAPPRTESAVRSGRAAQAFRIQAGRIIESLWRRRFTVCPTACGSAIHATPHCFSTQATYPGHAGIATLSRRPLLLKTTGHALVIYAGTVLTSRHLMLPGNGDEPIAVAELDDRLPGAVLLRNVSEHTWDIETAGESNQRVSPNMLGGLLKEQRAATVARSNATCSW